MNTNASIGAKIKKLRTSKKMTLKQLSEKADLSIGFLSQAERGMTPIAIDTLTNIAKILEVELNTFFKPVKTRRKINLTRNHEKPFSAINSELIKYSLSQDESDFTFLPREFHILPHNHSDGHDYVEYSHEGEEFIYVLEGILTLTVDGIEKLLYPGDCVSIHSEKMHNWRNDTSKITKIITINTPNPLKSDN
ncbi:MAG: XRE family transcriptional regulator [Anaerovoracaceae bacterium]